MMKRKLIPTNTKREDCVMTPQYLANALIKHFKPSGIVLEPCMGEGSFIRGLEGYGQNVSILWCEITRGKDFFDFKDKVNWIITNPPYSKMRKFIQHSMEVSDNIVFLTTINHLWLKARIRDIQKAGFGIKEIVIFDTPKEFPQSGFQIGSFHLKKDYVGDIKFKILDVKQEVTA
jgi:hypothetical protein